jgi:subtilisin family serine protease
VAEPTAPFPTAIPGVISASGSEQAAPPGAFSAPAQHVMTLRPQGEYDFASGSSVAAAEVTGIIALLLSASATPLDSGGVTELLRQNGGAAAGVLDVNAALAQVASAAAPAVASRGRH